MENSETQLFNVGRKIAKMREMRGLNQAELAGKINVSQQFISKVENGQMISDAQVGKFAEALGFHKQALLSVGEDKYVTYIQDFHCEHYHALVVADGMSRPAISQECEAVYARMVSDYQKLLLLMEKFKHMTREEGKE